jgi:hypothetical protein
MLGSSPSGRIRGSVSLSAAAREGDAMTKDSSLKRHVRERMTKTGESFTAARSQVVQKRDRVEAART